MSLQYLGDFGSVTGTSKSHFFVIWVKGETYNSFSLENVPTFFPTMNSDALVKFAE